jgi:DNA-binding GntR family transcriptional regulator
MDRTTLPDVERVFDAGTETEQQAIALACAKSRNEEIYELLKARRPDLAERISNGELTWNTLVQP